MLKKTRAAASGAKVTFVLPSQPNADHVHVVGDFNHWRASTPMKRQKDGSWRASVDLEPGEYEFRYLVDGNMWVNDEAADGYRMGPFGADNSVVQVAAPEGATKGASSSVRAAKPEGAAAKGGKSGSRSEQAGGSRSKAGGGPRRKGGPGGS